MPSYAHYLTALAVTTGYLAQAAPVDTCLSDPTCGPIPDESAIYSNQTTVTAPWPGNTTGAVLNTTTGPADADDLLFQNLLSAEWIIFSFYQQGVERFNSSSFTDAGFPNTTYAALTEIRDNEAGHLRIFQDQISSNSIKPGPCSYKYPFDDPTSYLALQTLIEVGSMAFLTGLELQAVETLSRGALVAIAETETRHNTWSLMSNWAADPFAGPADTFYPYADQILAFTNGWVVNGSCPSENPVYPAAQASPHAQVSLPELNVSNATSIAPGATVNLTVSDRSGASVDLSSSSSGDKFAVFFHGLLNVSVPFDTMDGYSADVVIPPELEARGLFVIVIADQEGAPTADSVLAGPLMLLEYPEQLGLLAAS